MTASMKKTARQRVYKHDILSVGLDLGPLLDFLDLASHSEVKSNLILDLINLIT